MLFVAEWIHFTLFGINNITHYETRSVHFLGLMNSAFKCLRGLCAKCYQAVDPRVSFLAGLLHIKDPCGF